MSYVRGDIVYQIKNLVFRYPKNEEDTIKGISFEIKKGEIFGLLGPSGVGKSTTQKILIKLLTDYKGEILYKGKDLKSYGSNYFEEVGVGFEMPVHFSKLTAEENLNFFKKLYSSTIDVDELLKRVGLYEDRKKKVSQFSKGMKVRLNFVRAMLNNPKVLFLDEPTNGLDPKNARIIKDLIKEFKEEGGTVLLTTHLMNDVDELCDRVAFMADGRIVEISTPKELKLKYGSREVDIEYRDGEGVKRATFGLDNLGENGEFLNIIKNYEIVTIHSKENTLDDIFIKVTGGPKMNKFRVLFWGEVIRLGRYNLFAASIFVSAIWVGILHFLNVEDVTTIVPQLIFLDVTTMATLLVGVSLIYERDEDTLRTLMVTPISKNQYLLGKVLANIVPSILSLTVMYAYSKLFKTIQINYLLLLGAVVLVSFFHSLIGMLLTYFSKSFTDLLMIIIAIL